MRERERENFLYTINIILLFISYKNTMYMCVCAWNRIHSKTKQEIAI